MAKKFNVIYKVAKETAYGTNAAALVLMASLNSVVDFTPVAKPNGTVDAGAASVDYNIQRVKRIKGNTVANVNAGTTNAALAALDQFSQVDWETIATATGALRSVGVKVGINEEYDIDNLGTAHAKAIGDSVNIQLIERHESLIEELFNAATLGGVLAYVKDDTKIFDMLSAMSNNITLLVDDYKAVTEKSNLVILMHPTVADMTTKEIGTVFNQEAAIYKTGLMAKNSINGVPVIIDGNLNKYQGADAKERLGAIIMDAEAIAFKAADETKPVSIDLGLTKFIGKYFYNIQKVIDPSRIIKLEFDATAATTTVALTKKVSD